MSQRKQNQAFTTIELLVVIGILVILMGMVFVAFRGVGNSAKKRATEVAMGSLKGLVAELDAANGLKSQPGAWLWWSGAGVINPVTSPPGGSTVPTEFWKTPYSVNVGGTWYADALIAPGSVTESNLDGNGIDGQLNIQRNASLAVLNTTLAMAQLAAVRANREAIQRMSQDSTFMPIYVKSQVPMPGNDFYFGYQSDGAVTAVYCQGVHIIDSSRSKKFYVAQATNPGQPPAGWYDESANPIGSPLFLDGWHNPIIFVPGSGLRVRLLNGQKEFANGDKTQNFIIVSPEGKVDHTSGGDPYVVTPGRPFWASAGPDGDFSKGDDNIYSFGE